MLKKVRDYMREHEMTAPGDAVIVALSGGADSVCLLTVLKQLATPEFLLRAVHVHHGIRGAEADRDEDFAQKLCESLSVPLCVAYCHVPAYAAEHGLSEEEAGRILRYQVLEKEAGKWEQELPAGSRVKIALAHHRDDNAETILHHLLRGSGLTGLAGIRPVQGRRIRPLLCVGREEIRAYLEAGHISWCEDSTNQSPDYTRNRIRSQVLPLLKTAVNEQAEEHILQAGQIIGQADAYLRQQAEEIWQEAVCGREEDLAAIPLTAFARQPEILKTYLIRHMLDQLHPGWKDIGSRHFTAIAELAGKPVGSRLDLPGGLMARTGYETLEIVRKTEREVSVKTESGADGEIHGRQTVPELHMTVFSRQKDQEIPKNQYTKWFDYDKIKGTLSVRTRRTGDYLILPSGGSKTIARYMIDEKIPKEKREQILLLAEGSHVLWVVGFRISEYYKIEEHTENILQVTCDGGKDYGR
ncbi:tRNA lysidine(34) synthetase TilS [Clostridium sp. AM33-3]|uniref:tRNA lysidine(34) synthetase TilS n=1 Tax=Clostridium sp. AM33-3 TaxID=2292304 RepID=UPI000E47D1D2|nr:tRNA lysidine(34) synthetase TilS [Clostridium sp. AM33-3]RHT24156.1 tRNA lysidine(34) synthetase TilS [Clostridium sp. AM33-3]